MTAGDLYVDEGPEENIVQWYAGAVSKNCDAICSDNGGSCVPTENQPGSLEFYERHIRKTQACRLPLLSSCKSSAPIRDSNGFCTFENKQSNICTEEPRFYVKCCTGTTCRSDVVNGGCSGLKTYTEAEEICEALGMDLCSDFTLKNGNCCDGECGYDQERVWSAETTTNDSNRCKRRTEHQCDYCKCKGVAGGENQTYIENVYSIEQCHELAREEGMWYFTYDRRQRRCDVVNGSTENCVDLRIDQMYQASGLYIKYFPTT
eukprot:UN24229